MLFQIVEPEQKQQEQHEASEQASLLNWQRHQKPLDSTKFELLPAAPDRPSAPLVCSDGPKLVAWPNASWPLPKCYSAQQWVERLWQEFKLAAFYYPLIVLAALIFLFGITGNVFVCLSVYRNHKLRNLTNYFIVNLAAADLLVIICCLPATLIWDLSLTWFLGTIACKSIMYLQDVSISVSVLTLAAISLDRYQAICHPLRFKSNHLGQAGHTIVAIWLLSLLVMTPDLLYMEARPSQELLELGIETVLYSDCDYQLQPDTIRLIQFLKTFLLYLLPLILMLGAHFRILRTLRRAASERAAPARGVLLATSLGLATAAKSGPQIQLTMHNQSKLESRRRAAKMLTAITLLFGLCYLPVHLINSLRQFIDDIPQTDTTLTISMLAHLTCYLNSAINPIIYNHMNSVFRIEFRKLLACFLCRPRSSNSGTDHHQRSTINRASEHPHPRSSGWTT